MELRESDEYADTWLNKNGRYNGKNDTKAAEEHWAQSSLWLNIRRAELEERYSSPRRLSHGISLQYLPSGNNERIIFSFTQIPRIKWVFWKHSSFRTIENLE